MSAPPREVIRIAVSMTAACAIGAAILGGVYVGTERYAEAARVQSERRAVSEMLALEPGTPVLEVRQYVWPERREVIYRTAGGGAETDLAFTFEGDLVDREGANPAGAANPGAAADEEKRWKPMGRLFVAGRSPALAGFVVEGESRGYKNRIRFFVALDEEFRISGVRVVQHEEDPGLGAEVATPWFQSQFEGRQAPDLAALDVTKDPMPEDWRAALMDRRRMAAGAWRDRYGSLAEREAVRPIYAVTGATISSRALTDGVRTTVDHFRHRWELIGPHLIGGNPASRGNP